MLILRAVYDIHSEEGEISILFSVVLSHRKTAGSKKSLQEVVVVPNINQSSNDRKFLVSSILSLRKIFLFWLLSL